LLGKDVFCSEALPKGLDEARLSGPSGFKRYAKCLCELGGIPPVTDGIEDRIVTQRHR
jgi:hypothetical protein